MGKKITKSLYVEVFHKKFTETGVNDEKENHKNLYVKIFQNNKSWMNNAKGDHKNLYVEIFQNNNRELDEQCERKSQKPVC